MLRRLVLLALAPLTLAAAACAGDGAAPGAPAVDPRNPIPAVAPPDQEAYRLGLRGQRISQETCGYGPDKGIVDCGERGFFRVEPPPAGDDASCLVGVAAGTPPAGGAPRYVLCSTPTGEDPKFYDIEGDEVASPQGEGSPGSTQPSPVPPSPDA